jgi:ubiquinone/menaquinone biosynthesis C-methylase UbiE
MTEAQQRNIMPDWFINELAHAGDEHLDADYVAAYDRKAGTDPTEDVARMRTLGLGEKSVLVDLGAGTGTLALAAAPYCQRVVAVDVSQPMLAVLRTQAEQSGLANVEVVQAGFLSYDHTGNPADFVYSRNALHHLPDFWKALALARTAAMMKPGGVLLLRDLVYSFDPQEAEAAIDPWLAGAAARRPEEGWTRAEYVTHLQTEYSTFSWLLEPMLERAGFAIRDVQHSPSRIYTMYLCEKKS